MCSRERKRAHDALLKVEEEGFRALGSTHALKRPRRAHGISLKVEGRCFMPSKCVHVLKVSRRAHGALWNAKG